MKQVTFINIGRSADYYHDESGERFRDVFGLEQKRRDAKANGRKQTIFWFGVIMLVVGLVAWRASL